MQELLIVSGGAAQMHGFEQRLSNELQKLNFSNPIVNTYSSLRYFQYVFHDYQDLLESANCKLLIYLAKKSPNSPMSLVMNEVLDIIYLIVDELMYEPNFCHL